ncbi:RNA polymerase sigma factor [Candidatus Gottesmanbacteria bacterium]|nr:RNA polymerase sigma factor [Candidatus Gottesmanbacteria bacterium]
MKAFSLKDEKELILGILQGDEKFLRIFYHLYTPRLFTFIKNRTATIEDAEEILQDSLLSSIDALRDFSYKSKLSTFLFSIAKNKVIDYYRKKKIKKIFFSQSPRLESLLITLLGPEEILANKQKKIDIDRVFSLLPVSYRRIITLKYVDDKSIIEITKELKLSFKSAESMLFRARKAFVKIWATI